MKKIALIFLLLLSVVFCLEAEVLSLKKIRERDYNPVILSKEFKQKIAADTKGRNDMEIVSYCNQKTQELLTFSTRCEEFNDKRKTKMHCVGYARVFSTICNYAFSVNGIKGRAKPVVGYVYYNGMNLNEYSSLLPEKWKNFTKDHDFAEVKLSDGKTIFVDPTLDIIQK
ncbi:MAG: transglutaminase-like domain-containing protein [Muribaculaceae bacterium]|nr:transglutaminase-like domain-containing protein [Muribaculaceae bacterium]